MRYRMHGSVRQLRLPRAPCCHARGPLRRAAAGPRPTALPSGVADTKGEIEDVIEDLDKAGKLAALLPGASPARQRMEALLVQLEALSPCAAPLGAPTTTAAAGSGAAASELLFGDWDLVYASNGTVVTRTAFAQALVDASSRLRGVGLTDIVQRLGAPSQVASTCSSSNEAVFGLGPLGTWHVVIQGHWRPKQPLDGVTARVAFDCFSIRLLGFMGATLPSWLPALQVPLPAAGDGADWATTYLDSDLRLGKGRSGNLFLFKRRRRRRSELL